MAGEVEVPDVPHVPEDDRVRQACAYLRILLSRPGDYRYRWERRAVCASGALAGSACTQAGAGQAGGVQVGTGQPARTGAGEPGTGPGEISEHAVAAVLTGPSGPGLDEPAELGVAHPARLETARRALAGSALHPDDLELFVTAFGLSERHAHRLRRLRQGAPEVRVLSGDLLTPEDVLTPPDMERIGPIRHETISLHELHTVGPDGRPVEHETIQLIQSLVPRLESVPYRFDTDQLMVQVVRGGRVGESIYRITGTLYGVDLILERPLGPGETALLQCHTTFAYGQPPPSELRRGIVRSTRDLTMWVRFHPQRVPARVYRARWDRIDHSRVVERQPAELDSELSVHFRFGRVEKAVVGFYWEWE